MAKVTDIFPVGKVPTTSRATQTQTLDHYSKTIPGWEAAFRRHRRAINQTYPNYNGRIGIEVEVENIAGILERTTPVPTTWESKGDGSLRNGGVEFVSKALVNPQIADSLASLYAWFSVNKARPSFSWRTSVHVHLEVRNLELQQLQNLLILYLAFEDSLFEFANADRREQNIFCTPLTRADSSALSGILQKGLADDPLQFQTRYLALQRVFGKYAALNLNHVLDFGTLEFRHIRGDESPIQLSDWTALILQLGQAATEVDRDWLDGQIEGLNTTSDYRQFAETVFGPELVNKVILRPFQRQLSDGVTAVKQVLFAATQRTPVAVAGSGLNQFAEFYAKKTRPDPLQVRADRDQQPAPQQEQPPLDAAPLWQDGDPLLNTQGEVFRMVARLREHRAEALDRNEDFQRLSRLLRFVQQHQHAGFLT